MLAANSLYGFRIIIKLLTKRRKIHAGFALLKFIFVAAKINHFTQPTNENRCGAAVNFIARKYILSQICPTKLTYLHLSTLTTTLTYVKI